MLVHPCCRPPCVPRLTSWSTRRRRIGGGGRRASRYGCDPHFYHSKGAAAAANNQLATDSPIMGTAHTAAEKSVQKLLPFVLLTFERLSKRNPPTPLSPTHCVCLLCVPLNTSQPGKANQMSAWRHHPHIAEALHEAATLPLTNGND